MYSIESLVSNGTIPAGVTVYTADFHDDFGLHYHREPSHKGIIHTRTQYAKSQNSNEREGMFWDHSTVCCDPTNYLAYLSWYSLREKTMPSAKQFIYLVKDEENVLWTLGVSKNSYQRVIFQDGNGLFYYRSQIPLQFQDPANPCKLRDFDAYFEETLDQAEALKKGNAHIPLDYSWVYDLRDIRKVRKNFESGIKRYRESQKLIVDFPIILYGNNWVAPELPCVSNLDLDFILNMEGITLDREYKAEIDLFYNRCNRVLSESPLIFIALSKKYTDDEKRIPTMAQYLVERICELPERKVI